MSNGVSGAWNGIASTLKVGLHSTVAKNAASLYVIQFAQYILPLITIPYLVRVLEPSGYGLVAFGQGFIAYFTIFADYGFALSATRKISLEREDISAVSWTASNVWASKALLGAAGFILLLLAVSLVPKLQESSTLLLILYGAVIGSVLFPTWLFQGMERMVAISVINLIMQLFILVGVFTLVHRPEDYIVYAVIISAGSIFSGLAGTVIAFFMFKLKPVMPSKKGILVTMREGWVLFLSQASMSLYTVGNAFILGLLANTTAAGYYSAAEKIVNAVLGLLGPVTQAAYPRFSIMAAESRDLALQWGQRMLLIIGGLGFILSVAIFAGAPILVNIVLGPEYEPSITVMRILAGLCFLIAASNVLGIQIMIPFGKDKAFTIILFGAGILNLTLAILLAPIWQESGTAVAVLFSEAFVTGAMFVYLSICRIDLLTWPTIIGIYEAIGKQGKS